MCRPLAGLTKDVTLGTASPAHLEHGLSSLSMLLALRVPRCWRLLFLWTLLFQGLGRKWYVILLEVPKLLRLEVLSEGTPVGHSQCAVSCRAHTGPSERPLPGPDATPGLPCTTHLWGIKQNPSWSPVAGCCLALLGLCGHENFPRASREHCLPRVNLGSRLTSFVAPDRLFPLSFSSSVKWGQYEHLCSGLSSIHTQ